MIAPILFAMLMQDPAPPQAAPPAITVTMSEQQSPYKLPAPLRLYSWTACNASDRMRVISPGQIAQAFEGAGGKFQDPALVPLMVTQYVQRSLSGRLLTVIQYAATAGAGVSAGIAGAKSTLPGLGSTKTWTYAAMGQAALGVAIPLAQKTLQGDVASQKATITAGVKAALIDMGDLPYTVPAGGCAAVAHRLFIGSGVTGAVKAVLP